MKVTHHIRISAQIDGLPYSQVEYSNDWEFEGENAEEMKSIMQDQIDEFVAKTFEATKIKYETQIQNLQKKLDKAREEYIKLKGN